MHTYIIGLQGPESKMILESDQITCFNDKAKMIQLQYFFSILPSFLKTFFMKRLLCSAQCTKQKKNIQYFYSPYTILQRTLFSIFFQGLSSDEHRASPNNYWIYFP
ncbi:hypothetical protein pb186bvf_007207 [Paramecium bursaria]